MDPQFIRVKIEAARRFKKNGQYKKAEKELLEALETDPNNASLKADLADIFYHLGRYNDSEKIVSEVLAGAPGNVSALYLAGLISYRKNKLEPSLEYFLELLKIRPDYFPAQKMVVTILIKQKEWDKAYNRAKRALAVHPEDTYLQSQLARIYRAKKQYEKALEIFKKLKTGGQDNEFVRKQIIELNALATGKDSAEMEKDVASMLTLPSQQDRPELWELRAENLRKKGDFSGAIEAYQKVIQLVPENDFARKQLAFVYKKMGDTEKAIEQMTPLFLKDPTDMYLRNSLFSLYHQEYGLWDWIQLLKEAVHKHPEQVGLYGLIKKYHLQLDVLYRLALSASEVEKSLEKFTYSPISEQYRLSELRPIHEVLIKFVRLKKMIPTPDEFEEQLLQERKTHPRKFQKLTSSQVRFVFQEGIFWIHFYLVSHHLPELKEVAYRMKQEKDLSPVVWVKDRKEIFLEKSVAGFKKNKPVIKFKKGLLLRIPADFAWSQQIGNWRLASAADLLEMLKML